MIQKLVKEQEDRKLTYGQSGPGRLGVSIWFVRNGKDPARQKELHETKTQRETEQGTFWDLQQPRGGRRA